METLVSQTQDFQEPDGKETIEMVISSSNNPAQLSRFVLQLKKKYNGDNNSFRIIGNGGSFGRGTFIIISIMSNSPREVFDEISNLPEVETTEEHQPSNGIFSRLPSLIARKRLSYYNSNHRFRVILNRADKES